ASRYPIRRAERLGESSTGEQGSVMRYELDAPAGALTVFNLHLATPRKGLGASVGFGQEGLDEIRANSELRLRQSEFVAAQARQGAGPGGLGGDLNTPPESGIFRRVLSRDRNAPPERGAGLGLHLPRAADGCSNRPRSGRRGRMGHGVLGRPGRRVPSPPGRRRPGLAGRRALKTDRAERKL